MSTYIISQHKISGKFKIKGKVEAYNNYFKLTEYLKILLKLRDFMLHKGNIYEKVIFFNYDFPYALSFELLNWNKSSIWMF